jgi:hypothetical protein
MIYENLGSISSQFSNPSRLREKYSTKNKLLCTSEIKAPKEVTPHIPKYRIQYFHAMPPQMATRSLQRRFESVRK